MIWSVPWGCNCNGWMDSNDSLTAIIATPSQFCDAILVAEEILDERKKKQKSRLAYINGKGNSKQLWLEPFCLLLGFKVQKQMKIIGSTKMEISFLKKFKVAVDILKENYVCP